MTTNNELKRLVDLTNEFARAAEKALVIGPSQAIIIARNTTPAEVAKIETLVAEVNQEKQLNAGANEPSESYLRKTLEFTEAGADLALRAVSPEKLTPFVPADLRNEKDAAALEKLGAPKLAALCRL
jgi:hypothetical protein